MSIALPNFGNGNSSSGGSTGEEKKLVRKNIEIEYRSEYSSDYSYLAPISAEQLPNYADLTVDNFSIKRLNFQSINTSSIKMPSTIAISAYVPDTKNAHGLLYMDIADADGNPFGIAVDIYIECCYLE